MIKVWIDTYQFRLNSNMKRIRKLQFRDLTLAFKVRQNVWNALIKFDQNGNESFETNEIKQALISILGSDQMEVQYVIKNVFRYDTNRNNNITYAQFTNFSVEQHFGEMAIQRLHKQGYYANGAQRIMNFSEFQATLNYCLETVNSKGTHQQYQQLFSEVDLDRDGYISYQDYFTFLRQYFGSQSEAFQQEQKNPRPHPKSQKYFDTDSPQQRFAKLIYSQFKLLVMDKDQNRNLILESNEVDQILTKILKLNSYQKNAYRDQCMQNKNTISYEDFIKRILVTYMSQIVLTNKNKRNFNEQQFTQFVYSGCSFVTIRPRQQVLRACFRDESNGASTITAENYSKMMKTIFTNFQFDYRGKPNKIKTQQK